MIHARNAHLFATDAQRTYLRRLCNTAWARRLDLGKWAGRDYAQAIDSDYLTKSDASDWIQHLNNVIHAK